MHGELFLTGYTMLSQAAVGLIIMLWIGSLFIGKEIDSKRANKAFLTAAVFSVMAMIISTLHLGSPFKAMNSLNNLATSWLSREIVMTNLFFLTTIWGVYVSRKRLSVKLPLLLGSIFGAFCVLCQAAIYAQTVFPAWSFGHAYVTFFAATLAMGSFLAVIFLLIDSKTENSAKVCLIYTLIATGAIIGVAGFYSLFTAQLPEAGLAGYKSLELLQEYQLLFVLRWVCSGIAIIGLGIAAYQHRLTSGIIALAILAIIGETLNRVVFYGIAAGIGL